MTQTDERTQALESLRGMLPPGATLTTVEQNAGSTRGATHLSYLVAVLDQGQPVIRDLTWLVARVSRQRRANDGGIVNGPDVFEIGYWLYPDGFTCVGRGCPSNDHANGDRDYSPHHHEDGGYALHHNRV